MIFRNRYDLFFFISDFEQILKPLCKATWFSASNFLISDILFSKFLCIEIWLFRPSIMDSLCKSFVYSRTALFEKFKQAKGVSIKNFLIDKRIESAKYMLTETNLPLNKLLIRAVIRTQTPWIRRLCGTSAKAFRHTENLPDKHNSVAQPLLAPTTIISSRLSDIIKEYNGFL